MAEFTSLNGYTVKDAVARNIAKGRNQAVAYSDYATMIETLNAMENDEFKTGQNIYIGTVGVPDLWVYSIEPIKHNFTYVSDEETVELLKNNVTIQAGFYRLAMLEGQKVDLTTINERIDECFQSVSDGKALIASAITDMGVETDATATFAEMDENIRSIETGVDISDTTASAIDVTIGLVFYDKDGNRCVGERPAPVGYQSGSFTMFVDTGSSASRAITFPEPFESVPSVTVSHNQDGRKYSGSASNITKTGCTIRISSTSSVGRNVNVTWKAYA